ncbi:MAG: hypothetical protein DCC52_01910 [Chloroflexi bacterium]|nr:MAG: hypothetical protein DCC52_01910 [Chloroflexota bacterium]
MSSWKIVAIAASVIAVLTIALAVISFSPAATAVAAPPAQEPTPAPPSAVVHIVPVPMNRNDPNAITGTLKIITDTQVGESNVTIAMGASGLPNVPVNVPVRVECRAEDVAYTGPMTPTWTLFKPTESQAAFKDPKANLTEFTPDVSGAYAVSCALPGRGEAGGVHIYAGAYIGNNAETCKTCHPRQVEDWVKTGHGNALQSNIDNTHSPDASTHFNESCAACHTTGFFAPPVGAGSNGFKDAAVQSKWQFPTYEQINAAGKGGKSNWDAMPAAVKAMANVGCEQCHGPAADHVNKGLPIMASSQNEGTCNMCHNSGNVNDKGEELKNAGHSDASSAAFNTPVGWGEQQCVRCHSGDGFVSFLANPTNPGAWKNNKQTIVCATCHDPHNGENAWQLRIVDKPVEIPFEVKQNVGLSATCYTCHNARTDPANAVKSSFPHYSSVAEFISNTGGVTYGQKVANSPHGDLVGIAPVPNPAAKENPAASKFLWSSADDEKGNTPGACVVCHMTPVITDRQDPNFEKVGGHSFNTVSPDGKFEYTASCQACHQDLTTFNMKVQADYDGNGKIEGAQDEVKGLLNVLLKALEAKGVKTVPTGYPYATLPKGADGQVDDKIDNAWYNFRTVYGVMWGEETGNGNEGKAQAIHNFKRAVQLLQLSYKDLTGQDVPGATLITK